MKHTVIFTLTATKEVRIDLTDTDIVAAARLYGSIEAYMENNWMDFAKNITIPVSNAVLEEVGFKDRDALDSAILSYQKNAKKLDEIDRLWKLSSEKEEDSDTLLRKIRDNEDENKIEVSQREREVLPLLISYAADSNEKAALNYIYLDETYAVATDTRQLIRINTGSKREQPAYIPKHFVDILVLDPLSSLYHTEDKKGIHLVHPQKGLVFTHYYEHGKSYHELNYPDYNRVVNIKTEHTETIDKEKGMPATFANSGSVAELSLGHTKAMISRYLYENLNFSMLELVSYSSSEKTDDGYTLSPLFFSSKCGKYSVVCMTLVP